MNYRKLDDNSDDMLMCDICYESKNQIQGASDKFVKISGDGRMVSLDVCKYHRDNYIEVFNNTKFSKLEDLINNIKQEERHISYNHSYGLQKVRKYSGITKIEIKDAIDRKRPLVKQKDVVVFTSDLQKILGRGKYSYDVIIEDIFGRLFVKMHGLDKIEYTPEIILKSGRIVYGFMDIFFVENDLWEKTVNEILRKGGKNGKQERSKVCNLLQR